MTDREQQQAVRIRELLDENEQLRDSLELLRSVIAENTPPILLTGLTPTENLMLCLLMNKDIVTKQQFMTAAYSDRPDDEPSIKIVDVYISKIRAKLAPRDIEIETIHSIGYRLSSEARSKLKALTATKTEVTIGGAA